eukprot:CAMPEP_0204906024 /NCGR_PEP_ID=MMETSP1397-20131031/5757_1 /ASSEMBLY_ACC=CAM_ASM_000891 /TAXON_ID=49980 /ORGANISM="Climacostomum Climacostomum virens, Strain Stock W-24" /LENGTH=200 /DNA_ID=CAMNT_0052074989 /DNA_START=119 /DNA_END=721 /DNA_ORIENTATION=-
MTASAQAMQTRMNLMTPDEQEEWIYIARLRGNRLFKANMFEQAAEVYLEAVTAAKIVCDEDQVHTLLCNLSACLLAQGKPQHALKIANQVLIENPKHIRALERRSKAYSALQQYDNAKADLINASSLSQDESSKNQFRAQLEELRIIEKKDKQTYERMFADQDSDEEDWIPVVSSVVKLFTLPVKLYRAVESLCRRSEEL